MVSSYQCAVMKFQVINWVCVHVKMFPWFKQLPQYGLIVRCSSYVPLTVYGIKSPSASHVIMEVEERLGNMATTRSLLLFTCTEQAKCQQVPLSATFMQLNDAAHLAFVKIKFVSGRALLSLPRCSIIERDITVKAVTSQYGSTILFQVHFVHTDIGCSWTTLPVH